MYTEELGFCFYVSVKVKGVPVTALLDSGCRQSVICAELVTPEQLVPGGRALIRCVHGDVKAYPTAQIPLLCQEGLPTSVTVGVLSSLPEQLILGTDNPHFMSLILKRVREGRIEPSRDPIHITPTLLTQEPWEINKDFR